MLPRLSVLFASVMFAFAVPMAGAETITVCADGCDHTSIIDAVAAAADGDVIQLAAETYAEGEEIVIEGKSLTIRGATDAKGQPASILDGAGQHRIMQCSGGSSADIVTLDNLVFRAGVANGSNGGGLYAAYVPVAMTNCRFESCSASSGGGAYLYYSDNAAFTATTFDSCSASYYGGGAYLSSSDDAAITSTTFESCSTNYLGGGAYLSSSDDAAITSTTFESCSTNYLGGGLYQSGGSTMVGECLFANNTAASLGGGIRLSSGTLAVSDSTLCGNTNGAIVGSWTDEGGNCLAINCKNVDGDGSFDCEAGTDLNLSVPDEYVTIEDAFAAAADGATIHIGPGVQEPSASLDTLGRELTLVGTVDGEGEPASILQGGGVRRILNCVGGNSAVTIQNLVFRSGVAEGGQGGGLHAAHVPIVMMNCRFENCSASSGGGAYLYDSDNSTITSTTFESCSASYGGGAYLSYSDNAAITSTTFESCSASYGGGLSQSGGSTMVGECLFTNNTASSLGGGIRLSSGTLAVSDSALCGNTNGAIAGSWTDEGGNCLAVNCEDADGDGDFDCGNGTDLELSVPDEYSTLEEAFAAAADGATIHIGPGVYALSETLDTLSRDLSLVGSVDDDGAPISILDGGGARRILMCVGGVSGVTIENLVFRAGVANGSKGGGLYAAYVPVAMTNCRFESCSASSSGGGAYLSYSDNAAITSTTFVACTTSYDGGGVYLSYSDNAAITSTTFESCSASYDSGGVYLSYSDNAAITSTTFESCSASYDGGGVYLSYSDNAAITSTTFESCSASSGGGIQQYGGSAAVADSFFTNNTASSQGSGIRIYFGSLSVVGSTLCGNTSGDIAGWWTDQGGNCVRTNCQDTDGDGVFDCGTDLELFVPDEYATIEDAFVAAADGATIHIGPGVHELSETLDTLSRELTLMGSVDGDGGPASILDGGGVRRILTCLEGATGVTIENLVFRSGVAKGGSGGGLYVESVPVAMTNCRFENCEASRGGGLYLDSSGNATITSTTFESCSASTAGGGLCLSSSNNTTLASTTFHACSAAAGGGVFMSQSSNAILTATAFFSCSAYIGGGAYLSQSAHVTIASTTFDSNSASASGGGAYMSSSEDIAIMSATFKSCSANSGGGIYQYQGSTAIADSLFTDNTAAIIGGGIRVSSGSLSMAGAFLCGNIPDAIADQWTDEGGNCLAVNCQDTDGDGMFDCGTDLELFVPDEYATIEDAFVAAADGATIHIGPGVHELSETLDTLSRELTLMGSVDGDGGPASILDGGGVRRILTCLEGATGVTIENLVFRSGVAKGGSGGGLYVESVPVAMTNCRFEGCSATSGGGVYLSQSNNTTLTSTRFDACSASSSGGGAYLSQSNNSTFTSTTFESCSAYIGGGAYFSNSNDTNLTSTTFDSSSASYAGGGLHQSGGSTVVADSLFANNTAASLGGGIRLYSGTLALSGSTICGNVADAIEGAWTDGGGNCIVSECVDLDSDGMYDCYDGKGEDLLARVPDEYPSIEIAAIFVADGGVIEVGPGEYVLSSTVSLFDKSVVVRGSVDAEDQPTTILDGGGAFGLFSVQGTGQEQVRFEQMVLRGGAAVRGGAIDATGVSLTIVDCLIEGNLAEFGGAVALTGAEALVEDSVIDANVAGDGGALWLDQSTLAIRRSHLRGNVASGVGGIGWCRASSLVLESMVLEPNTAASSSVFELIESGVGFLDVEWSECCLIDPDLVIDLGGNDFGWPCTGCVGDVDCDQTVGSTDLGQLLSAWGTDDPRCDFDGDGIVRSPDLGIMLGAWGVCDP